jgi:hypothetical protein
MEPHWREPLEEIVKKTFEEPEFVENKIEEISESIGDERLSSETTTENAEEATS